MQNVSRITTNMQDRKVMQDSYNCPKVYPNNNIIVSYWNALAQHVIEAPTVNTFKNRLDKHWTDMGI